MHEEQVTFDLKAAGKERMPQLNAIDEMRDNAHENTQIYKEMTKVWHARHIWKHEFEVGQKVLLYNSRLQLFFGKSRSCWTGPFLVTEVFPYGAIEISDETMGTFKVNGQRLKPYFEGEFSE